MSKNKKFTKGNKRTQFYGFVMGRDWHSIALDYVKEHKVKKKDFGKFVLRISRQFQGNRKLPNLAEGYGANGNIVEHIENHKRSEYGTLLFLCKFINWELNGLNMKTCIANHFWKSIGLIITGI